MSLFNIIITVVAFVLMALFWHLANRVVRNSQQREEVFLASGHDVNVTILSMRQNGLFINNNPVIDMTLRVEEPVNHKSWLIENHQETAYIIAVGSYQVGNMYKGKFDSKANKVLLVKDASGKPLLAAP
ncbi:hypothetical protein [Metakosakonia massiliensis]|uniref:Uncharacterized protein n=1 Tax=Phytobacter massiliensis TaxID=1485952 RepID=A0A6N3HM60_9ENTR|nr:hypothetical protein [Phytobacter massiliensis]